MDEEQQDELAQIVRTIAGRVDVCIVCWYQGHVSAIKSKLEQPGVHADSLRYLVTDFDVPWIRDFGPIFVRDHAGEPVALDFEYDVGRPGCDDIPKYLARDANLQPVSVPLIAEGGNLLSNGEGLLLTSERILESNNELAEVLDRRPYGRHQITKILRRNLGADQVVYLTPLRGEMSGHVDMFAVFTAPDTIAIGQYSPAEDPINAAILDENAARLAKIKTATGPLKVERIPMPRSQHGIWRSFTNVVFANGVLVMPVFDDGDEDRAAQAKAIYERLLPGWQVAEVESSALFDSGGGPHCITMNEFAH